MYDRYENYTFIVLIIYLDSYVCYHTDNSFPFMTSGYWIQPPQIENVIQDDLFIPSYTSLEYLLHLYFKTAVYLDKSYVIVYVSISNFPIKVKECMYVLTYLRLHNCSILDIKMYIHVRLLVPFHFYFRFRYGSTIVQLIIRQIYAYRVKF